MRYEGKWRNNPGKVRTEKLEKYLEGIENKTIILEPTTTAINLARKLRKNNEVLLSHPYKTKLIAESKKKTRWMQKYWLI